jgi:hypothetical protein
VTHHESHVKHAECLVCKLDAFTDFHCAAQQRIRELIWRIYRGLKAYEAYPSPQQGRIARPLRLHL